MNRKKEKNTVSLINGLWVNDWNYNLRFLLVFAAAEILMAYSPFGFIVFPTISMTTLFIGVLAAALWGGPLTGAGVGAVFGLTSMWKASVTAVNPNDLIFSPIKSGNPMGSIILALGPRVLFGVVAGLVYYLIMRWAPRKARVPILMLTSAVLERVHSMLTYLFIDKVFHVEGASMFKAFDRLFAASRIQIYVITMLIILAAYLFYDRMLSRKFYEEFTQIKENRLKFRLKYAIIIIATLVVIALTATHLWERIQIVLFDIDQYQPELTNMGLILQVIIQYVVATISALYIVVALYRHISNIDELERSKAILQRDLERERAQEMEERSLKDPLTGVFNRKGLKKVVEEDNLAECPIGFMLIDIDHFKEINDNYGHDAGDLILTELTKRLKEVFGDRRVFRLGGDEFAAITSDVQRCNEKGLMEKWQRVTDDFALIHKQVTEILAKDISVTVSVGICYSEKGYQDKLYPLADSALYETKNHGRAGCTLVDQECKVLASWKDPSVKTDSNVLEISNTGITRIQYPLDGSTKPRMFCNETTRNLMSVPLNASPEECYEIWIAGIDQKYLKEIERVRKELAEKGMTSFDYVWNHPLRGKVRVESGGTAKKKNGMISILSYHQLYF